MGLIDGRKGKAHINSQQIADSQTGLFAKEDVVVDVGAKFLAEIVNSNQIDMYDGLLLSQGRRSIVEYGEVIHFTIENGTQGVTRNDLIVHRYTKDSDGGTEDCEWVIVKGEPNKGDPEIEDGTSVREGARVHEFALYRVRLDGINIVGIDTLFTIQPSMQQLSEKLDSIAGTPIELHELWKTSGDAMDWGSRFEGGLIYKKLPGANNYSVFAISFKYEMWYNERMTCIGVRGPDGKIRITNGAYSDKNNMGSFVAIINAATETWSFEAATIDHLTSGASGHGYFSTTKSVKIIGISGVGVGKIMSQSGGGSSQGGGGSSPSGGTSGASTFTPALKSKLEALRTDAEQDAIDNNNVIDIVDAENSETGAKYFRVIKRDGSHVDNIQAVASATLNGLMSKEQYSKLASLDESHFKGRYDDFAQLNTAFPTAIDGDYSYVGGVGVDESMYIWDSTDSKWVMSSGNSTAETPASVKSKYESNVDTNAFTDALKEKLEELTPYTAMTEAEMKTGTATTSKTITAQRLKQAIEYHAPSSGGGTSIPQSLLDRLDTMEDDIRNREIPVGGRFITDVQNGYPQYGTWVLSEQGQFIAGTSGTAPFAAGATGGSKDAIVPSHKHNATSENAGKHNHVPMSSPSELNVPINEAVTSGGGWLYGTTPGSGNGKYKNGNVSDYVTSTSGEHAHNVTVDLTGVSATNANLPPYKSLYIYKRTA